MAKLKYKDKDGFWQELPVGTNVVANPALTGTEQELTSLQVGNAKYKSSGGGKLYQHNITFTYHEGQSDYAYLFITIFAEDKIRKMTSVTDLYTGLPNGFVRMSYYNASLSTNTGKELGLPAFLRSYLDISPNDVKLCYYDLTGAVQEINISSAPSWVLKNYTIIDIESGE